MTITKIIAPRRTPNRRKIYLDGVFAFACHLNVVAKFRLREGMTLSPTQVDEIQLGEVRQECFDAAIRLLRTRLQSVNEIRRKLMRNEYGEQVVEAVIGDLIRLGYLDDERFAKTKAAAAVTHRQHGRRRAKVELLKAGVKNDVAERALDDVYATADSLEVARRLALKQAARLKKLDPLVARRRLAGMLQRRGFEYDAIKPVIDEVLAKTDSPE